MAAKLKPIVEMPERSSYDVVIIGGAMIGSSSAWWLTNNPDFNGSLLVVEMDPSYEFTSTSHTNSCIRQQFSTEVNIRISQFGAEFMKNFRENLGGDPEVPHIPIQNYGYMYLADNDEFAGVLAENQKLQEAWGAGTKIMTAEEIKEAYPFYMLDDIVCGSHNLVDEGYFDGNSMFQWWRRKAREKRKREAAGKGGPSTSVRNASRNASPCSYAFSPFCP